MTTLHDSAILEDVYDIIFKNTQFPTLDFCGEFPASWIDLANARIYLGIEEDKPLFKINIERL